MNEKEDRMEKFLKLKEEYKKKRENEREESPEKFKPQWPYELFGIECGEGWKKLYQPIIDYIEEYNKDKEEEDKIEIHQIKEKFGGLRVYVSKYTKELEDMIRKAEEESFTTCEDCGKKIDTYKTHNHWMYALCDECFDNMLKNQEEAMKRYEERIKEAKNTIVAIMPPISFATDLAESLLFSIFASLFGVPIPVY